MAEASKFKNRPVLVFDLGRVLIDFDPDIIISRLSPYTYWSRDDMYRLFATADFVDAFERGRINADEFFDILIRALSLREIDKDVLFEIWNDMFFPKPEMLRLIRFIRQNTDIGLVLLSNISPIHFEYLYTEYKELSLFDDYVLSYRVGYRKPEAGIYRRLLEAVEGGRAILYTDDIEQFVYAAKDYGIDAVHFKGYDAYLHELVARPEYRPYFDKIVN